MMVDAMVAFGYTAEFALSQTYSDLVDWVEVAIERTNPKK